MATTIKLKNGSGAPSASDLVQGEPALDLTNNRLYSENSSGSVVEIGTNPTSLSINGTAITATAAELNILDGVTSTAAELNILDGVTSTAAELNILDGVTSTAGEINLLDGSTAGTVVNSKAVIYGSSGEVKGTTFQTATNTSGNLLIGNGTAFASTAVGDLSEISSVAGDDVLLAIDTSGGGLKKITRSTLVSGLATSTGISNIVEDTTPQLGGSLDVNGQDIVSVSNGNITLTPNGTGLVRLDGNVDIQSGEIVLKNSGSVSNIKFYCESSNAHYTQLQSSAHSAYSGNVTLTLPPATDTLVGRDTTDTLTNKTLTSPDINTPDIDGGTIDGTVVGGSTAAAGSFTALSASTSFSLNGVAITSTAAELNILDGVTSTASELNLVDGSSAGTIVNSKAVIYGSSGEVNATTLQIAGTSITSTAAELNILDGVTASTAELNILDGVTSTAAELNILDGVTSTAAELNLLDGSTANTVVNSKAVVYGSGGEIAATSYTGDGSALTGIDAAPSLTATASGALANGDPVIVNADGTVSAISETTESSSSPAEWAADTNMAGAAYDTTNNKIVIAFKDGDNSNKGSVFVGTISSSSISFGTKIQLHNGQTPQISCAFDSNAEKVLIVFKGNSNYGYAVVGTVSGTSISLGTEVVFNTGTVALEGIPSVVYHEQEQSFVIGYTRSGVGAARVATISGTSVSVGSEVTVNSGNTAWMAVSYDVAADKILFVYADTANNQWSTARAGTVSGNSISFGSEAVLDNSGTSSYQAVTYDSTAQKHIIAYLVGSYPKYIVATVSGTSVSAGSAASYAEATYTSGNHIVQYDPAANKTLFAWRPSGRSGTTNDLTLRSATLSGTTLSFGSADIVGTGSDTPLAVVNDPDNNLNVVVYFDSDDGYAGDYVLFTHAGISSLTSENYIGISNAAYSDGATATVQLVGSVDDAQSGLTAGQAYYVQPDGSLSTTADTPSVFAGTAVSATKLIVKG